MAKVAHSYNLVITVVVRVSCPWSKQDRLDSHVMLSTLVDPPALVKTMVSGKSISVPERVPVP